MNQKALNDIVRFAELPETEEQQTISQLYLDNKIDNFEFHSRVVEYLREYNKGNDSES